LVQPPADEGAFASLVRATFLPSTYNNLYKTIPRMMNAIPAMLSSRIPVAHPTSKVKIPITIINSDADCEIGLTFTDMVGPPLRPFS
jgi:hypothetical protein